MNDIFFRKADMKDLDLTYIWANDKETRKNSFDSNEIGFDEHKDWFKKKLDSCNSHIYIFMNGSSPIGVLRLDVHDDISEISYSIDQKYRGQGYGKKMLLELEKLINEDRALSKHLKAEVKFDNIASQKIFEKLNYGVIKKSDRLEFFKTIG